MKELNVKEIVKAPSEVLSIVCQQVGVIDEIHPRTC